MWKKYKFLPLVDLSVDQPLYWRGNWHLQQKPNRQTWVELTQLSAFAHTYTCAAADTDRWRLSLDMSTHVNGAAYNSDLIYLFFLFHVQCPVIGLQENQRCCTQSRRDRSPGEISPRKDCYDPTLGKCGSGSDSQSGDKGDFTIK